MRKFWILGLFFATAVAAQQAAEIWGTIYLSSAPSPADQQTLQWRSNSGGQLVTDISGGPPASNDLLLVDGVSYMLLADGVGKLCLASGC